MKRLNEISASGDPLETLNATVDFEMFRPILERTTGASRSAKGGRPPFDAVLKFRMLVLQSLHGLSLEGEADQHLIRWIILQAPEPQLLRHHRPRAAGISESWRQHQIHEFPEASR